jgi:hypothetical protein
MKVQAESAGKLNIYAGKGVHTLFTGQRERERGRERERQRGRGKEGERGQ